MPDRQRHSRLSDGLGGLFGARSGKPPAGEGRHRGAAPGRPAGAGRAARQQDVTESASRADGRQTVDLSRADLNRVMWEPSDLPVFEPDRPASPGFPGIPSSPDSPDPMADTTQLSRVTLPWLSSEPTDRGFGPGAGPASGFGAAADRESASRHTASSTHAASSTHTAASAGAAAAPTLLRSFSVQALIQNQRRRLTIGAAGVVALVILLALPPVRDQLRDSFFRKPQPYTALYFTTPPQVDGTVLTVPVSVHARETGTSAYRVRVWTVDTQGRVDDSRTADLKWDGQALSAVVSMPVNPAADFVWVSLGGSEETLHYKIAVA